VGGLGMLIHQAAASLKIWTGLEPPLEAMERATMPSGGEMTI
jgi:shikimate 5-dehydrogenase